MVPKSVKTKWVIFNKLHKIQNVSLFYSVSKFNVYFAAVFFSFQVHNFLSFLHICTLKTIHSATALVIFLHVGYNVAQSVRHCLVTSMQMIFAIKCAKKHSILNGKKHYPNFLRKRINNFFQYIVYNLTPLKLYLSK